MLLHLESSQVTLTRLSQIWDFGSIEGKYPWLIYFFNSVMLKSNRSVFRMVYHTTCTRDVSRCKGLSKVAGSENIFLCDTKIQMRHWPFPECYPAHTTKKLSKNTWTITAYSILPKHDSLWITTVSFTYLVNHACSYEMKGLLIKAIFIKWEQSFLSGLLAKCRCVQKPLHRNDIKDLHFSGKRCLCMVKESN